jgi:hypothetical protein
MVANNHALETGTMRLLLGDIGRAVTVVDPENRLVARGLEAEWETRLRAVANAEAELLTPVAVLLPPFANSLSPQAPSLFRNR